MVIQLQKGSWGIGHWLTLILIILSAAMFSGCSSVEDNALPTIVHTLPASAPSATTRIQPTYTPIPESTSTPALSCRDSIDQYIARSTELINQWNETKRLISNTEQNALSGPFERLKASRRDVAPMKVEGCAQATKAAMLRHMDHFIEGYSILLDPNKLDGEAPYEFVKADAALAYFEYLASEGSIDPDNAWVRYTTHSKDKGSTGHPIEYWNEEGQMNKGTFSLPWVLDMEATPGDILGIYLSTVGEDVIYCFIFINGQAVSHDVKVSSIYGGTLETETASCEAVVSEQP